MGDRGIMSLLWGELNSILFDVPIIICSLSRLVPQGWLLARTQATINITL